MQVPEDVTLLFSDDNWGNIRRLPELTDAPRLGGYGVYYHFDYVGDPRNYKWLNTSPISRIWEQMHLAYCHGVDRIWIVNVGDIKPLELPTQFFLDYAWNPQAWSVEQLPEYTRCWAEQQFGAERANDIARILNQYTRYNSRRKPELLAPDTYSLVNYHEAGTIVDDYNKVVDEAELIYNALPAEFRDAYYQLVLHTVKACANLNELYVTVGKNRLYARQGRVETNDLAARTKQLFDKDAEYSRTYNRILAGGKWNHMMDQTHIGYTTWQQPKENIMPRVEEISIPDIAEMGVSIEGSEDWWPQAKNEPVLPEFDVYQQQTVAIEVFNRGKTPFDYHAEAGVPWLLVAPAQGKVEKGCSLSVSVDWQQAPHGTRQAPITITGPGSSRVIVRAVINNPLSPKRDEVQGFVEGNGCVSMEAEHFSRAVEAGSIRWQHIPDLGRTLSGMTPFPVTAQSQVPGGNSPRLEYRMHLFSSGMVKVQVYLSPTLDFRKTQGLRYAISFDDELPQIIPIWADRSNQAWELSVSDNIKVAVTEHRLDRPGAHILKFWMVDPGVILQKLVVDSGDLRPSYLGPPESFFMTEIVANPKRVSDILEIITTTIIRWLHAQLDTLRQPEGLLLLDDVVGMVSKQHYETLIHPHLKRIFDEFDGLIRIYNNDTPCLHLAESLALANFDVFNFSHKVDMAEIKAKMGQRVALMGSVPPLDVGARGQPIDVIRWARTCLEKGASGGGLILSFGGGVSPDTPPDNIDALVQVVHDWSGAQ